MRIIKDADNVLATIAGEMLNIETSTLHFTDGKPADVPAAEYSGYPRMHVKNVVNIIRSAEGYIFVPAGTNLATFEGALLAKLLELEKTMKRGDTVIEPLRNYHSTHIGGNTNIKVKSAQKLNAGSTNNGLRVVQNNVLRQFVQDDDKRQARFIWHIKHISDINFDINSDNIRDSIARFASSVFYDKDDICVLPHNATTFEFNPEMLRGQKQIIPETVRIFKYGNPLMFELSEYWRAVNEKNAKLLFRNIAESKVYEIDYNELQFLPVSIGPGETSTEVCAKCKCVLWGENYALAGNVKDAENPLCLAMCPLCVHSGADDKPIEHRYMRVYRFTSPRSDRDMLDMAVKNTKCDILEHVVQGIESSLIDLNHSVVHYTLIGSKYVSFRENKDFLYTEVVNNPLFKDRMVCKMVFVE